MKKALILGATGFIGSNLAEKLGTLADVLGYDRIPADVNYPLILGSFAEERNFEDILRDNQIDTVYHLISTTVPREDTSEIALEVETNVIPTLRLLEAMRKSGVRKMVFVSSGGTVYGDWRGSAHVTSEDRKPICGYGMQKMVIEDYLSFYNRRYGMDCRVARLSNPYGVPPQRPRVQGIIPFFMEKLLQGEPITMFGDTLRDYIHIDDAIEAMVRYSFYAGDKKVLNIGTGVPVRISDIVRLIEVETGKKFVSISHQPIRSCDVQESVLDVTETMGELDWKPEISLEDGIRRTWQELQQRSKAPKGQS